MVALMDNPMCTNQRMSILSHVPVLPYFFDRLSDRRLSMIFLQQPCTSNETTCQRNTLQGGSKAQCMALLAEHRWRYS